MKQYLLILLISSITCSVKNQILERELIPASEITSFSQAKKNVDYTLCAEFINSDFYKEFLEQFRSELPDDISEEEIGLAICQKVYESGKIDEVRESMAQNVNTMTKLYKVPTKKLIPFKEVDLIEEDIRLKGLFSWIGNIFKNHWRTIVKGLLKLATFLCPEVAPIVTIVTALL